MGTTIIGGGNKIPFKYEAPIIEISQGWPESEDGWQLQWEYDLVSLAIFASSSQVSQAQIHRRYGIIKNQANDGYNEAFPKDLHNYWVRISLTDPYGDPAVQFMGVVDTQTRVLQGTVDQGAGHQNWLVSGGLKVLQKLQVTQAAFDDGASDVMYVDWIPPMNKRDRRGLLVGNRSDDIDLSGSYSYGGTPGGADEGAAGVSDGDSNRGNLWTHLQYLQYLVDNFIQQPAPAPTWTIGGQTSVLEKMITTIDFGQVTTAAQMLSHLIPVKYGVDYMITPKPDGFEITIFALSSDAVSVAAGLGGTCNYPGNPNIVQVQRNGEIGLLQTQVVESLEKRYDRIEVAGKRIVVCGSLRGKRAPEADGGGTLVPKWSDAVETDYIAAGGLAAGGGDVEAMDQARKREKYRDVYRHLGAPADWKLDNGKWSLMSTDDGQIIQSDQYQTLMRETLNWIPMKEGFDYSDDPAIDLTQTGTEPEVKPPICWVLDEIPLTDPPTPRYVQCDLVGIHVSHPFHDWGVFLHPTPAHDLARNHWSDAQLATTLRDEQRYDYETVVATIAIESDHRLMLGYDVPNDMAAGDGSVLRILDEQAECWVMLPSTVVDIDKDGELVTWDGGRRLLRNDVDRLGLQMAGLVSRYSNERARAALIFAGIWPWADLLGQIMTVVQNDDDQVRIGAPITSIEWSGTGESKGGAMTVKMTIKTGYA